jgi:hypothetical protein
MAYPCTDNKAMSQHETDVQSLREKTARLRKLRLAQEAVNAATGGKAVANGQMAIRTKAGKPLNKAPLLSDWLATQQKEGRRG